MARLPYTIPYDEYFLGNDLKVPLPVPSCQGSLYRTGEVIDYIHFSLVMHDDRRSALYTAHNIDADQIKSVSRTGWDTDSRIPLSTQTDNSAYRNNPYDRGHLVRRAAVAWGDRQRAKDASDSTFYYTNAALQHSSFNQDDSKWLGLENWVLQKAGSDVSKLSVFTGPIYTKIDEFERGYRIPSAFFKVVVLKDPTSDEEDLSALGFVMTQNEGWRLWGGRELTNLEPYIVSIKDIELYTGLHFGQIADLDEYDWRQPRFRDRSKMRHFPVNGPEDIHFNGNKRRNAGIRAIKPVASSKHSIKDTTYNTEDCHECSSKSKSKDQQIQMLSKQLTDVTEVLEDILDAEIFTESKDSSRSIRTGLAKITGGDRVPMGSYPECVAVGNNQQYFCTGVLVAKNIVLTAAHCAPDITRVFLKSRQLIDSDSAEIIGVQDVFVHPDYNPNYAPWHDIAVLVLQEDSTVAPVGIATNAQVDNEDSFTIVGFGNDDLNGQVGFGTKREAIVSQEIIIDAPNDVITNEEHEHGFDHQYEFRAGRHGSGIDTCTGDSGGPIYLTQEGARVVAGLTSRGAFSSETRCGNTGLYTKIAPYASWINSVSGQDLFTDDNEQDNSAVAINSTTLYISSTMPNPTGHDSGNEWIEISNPTSSHVELDKYLIRDKQGGQHSLSGRLVSGSSSRITIPSNSPVKLGNGGDEISLVLVGGNQVIHKVDYPSAGSGQIIHFDAPFSDNTDNTDNPLGDHPLYDPC